MASSERITVNGTNYESLDDVPQPYRDAVTALMADRDGDGVPDVFDGESESAVHATFGRSETYVVDGVTYSSIDEMPEPHRTAMRGLTTWPTPGARTGSLSGSTPPTHSTPAVPVAPSPIVSNAGLSPRAKLLAAFVAVDAVVVAAVVWFVVR